MRIVIVLLVVVIIDASSIAAPVVYNQSFELPVVPVPGGDDTEAEYEPTLTQQGGAGWDFEIGPYGLHSGITQNRSGFTAVLSAPDGFQQGFMWSTGDTIAQTIYGFEVGKTYIIKWWEAARPGTTTAMRVMVDTKTLMSSHVLSNEPDTTWEWVQQAVPFTATNNSHRIRFIQIADWDEAVMIDNVEVIDPQKASMPYPANGCNIDPNVPFTLNSDLNDIKLAWVSGEGATSHKLYFGTDFSDVEYRDAEAFLGEFNTDINSYQLPALNYETTYYWCVDEVNEGDIYPGDIWRFATGKSYRDIYSDTWVATDAMGRELPTYEQCGEPRDKSVFIMYLLWLDGMGDGPYDITKLLAENPTDPAWGPHYAFHYWGEPEVGYYTSKDEWVMRRHIHYLSAAGVDVLMIDATNSFTYHTEAMKLCKVITQIKNEGGKTPKILFWTHALSPQTVEKLYTEFYSKGYYQDLWYYMDGKPLILGWPDGSSVGEPYPLSQEIKDFFTWREFWAMSAYYPGDIPQYCWGTSLYPQRYGWDDSPDKVTQTSVLPSYGPHSNVGRSYHNFTQPPLDVYGLPVAGTEGQGWKAQEEFDRALKLDPDILTIFRWNEWVAQRWIHPDDFVLDSFLGQPMQDGQTFFVDSYNAEFTLDLEPMKGGYTDNYYYQTIDYLRRFKGVRPLQITSKPKTIVIDGEFTEWDDVQPEFRDHVYDTIHRNCQGWGNAGTYINTTGRNDLLNFKVARDDDYVYFYAETCAPLTSYTDPNWMLLFIRSYRDCSAPVYNGSFELPVVPVPGGDDVWAEWEPTLTQQGGAGWDFINTGNHSGITFESSILVPAGSVPNGRQVGFVWCTGDELAQTVGGLEIGQTYTVSWSEAGRPGSSTSIKVLIDDTEIIPSHSLYNAAWTLRSAQFTATATAHRLRFIQTAGWDQMAFVDNVAVQATGWEGYDYLVNYHVNSETRTTLMHTRGGWNWTTVNSHIAMAVNGNKLELAIPRADIGQGSGTDTVAFDFHWADNIQKTDDIGEFFISGDSAPDRRFRYRYDSSISDKACDRIWDDGQGKVMDLNSDCVINLNDMVLLAEEWLRSYTLTNLAELANDWLENYNLTSLPAVTLLADDFENGLGSNWTTDWDMVTSNSFSPAYSIECGSEANSLVSKDLNTAGQSSIHISFKYRITAIDADDDVYVQYYNGSTYNNIKEIGDDDENVWLYYNHTIDDSGSDTQYFMSNFRLRIEGMSVDSGESLLIDDVLITATE